MPFLMSICPLGDVMYTLAVTTKIEDLVRYARRGVGVEMIDVEFESLPLGLNALRVEISVCFVRGLYEAEVLLDLVLLVS
jgi:hypothetical protein